MWTVLLNCRYREQNINWTHFHSLLLFQDLRKGLSWRRLWFCWSLRSPCFWSPPSSSQERWGCVLEAARLPDHRSWPSRTRLPCLCVLTCKTCTTWTTRILTSSLVIKVRINHNRSKKVVRPSKRQVGYLLTYYFQKIKRIPELDQLTSQPPSSWFLHRCQDLKNWGG